MTRNILLTVLTLLLLGGSLSAQEEYFGKNKVQYKSFDWSYIQSPNFDIYFYQGEYELAKFAAAELESSLVVVDDELNYKLRGRVPIFIYNSSNEFQQTNITSGLLPESVGGFTESFKNRVVVPFDGSYEDFRHVLHHELTHAVIFDMLYGNVLGSLVSRDYLFSLPLWFSEGYAEYSSLGWDDQADMVVRDATIQGYLQPLTYLGGYLAYKEGQAAVKYIADRYGVEKIGEIIGKGKATLSMDKALKSSIGLDEKELYKQLSMYLKRVYWPELAERKEPSEIGKRLTDHKKDGSYFNEAPVFSPDGDKLAIFSDRSDYTEIYLISAIDGKRIDRLVKSFRSGDLESLHSYVSGITWSRDGRKLAFVAKSDGNDALFIYDLDRRKVVNKLRLKFNSIYSPNWGEGNQIAFTGVRNDKSDIYLIDAISGEWKQITDDRHDDKDVCFSPDGSKIAFSSDRPVVQNDSAGFTYGTYNIFIIDVKNGDITPVTNEKGICRYPQWSPDGGELCFTSDLNGIDNLYIKELDKDTEPYPITNVLTGIKSPSWSPKGDMIAFSSFNDAGYDIFVLKDIKPLDDNRDQLTKTIFAKGELNAEYINNFVTATEKDTTVSSEADTSQSKTEEEPPEEGSGGDYVFTPPKSDKNVEPGEHARGPLSEISAGDGRDTLYQPLPGGEYKIKKYKAKFTPDLVAGGVSYDAFYGLRGQSLILISDYLGNQQFYIFTDLVNSINQSNLQAIYLNSSNRLNFGLGLFHNKNYFIDPSDRLFSDRTYGVMASAWYPFSLFRRVQVDFAHTYIDRVYYDPPYDDSNDNVTNLNLSLVQDKVLWGLTGPVNGSRWKLTLERTLPLSSDAKDYWATELDWRKYWHIKGSYLVALRVSGGASFGKDHKSYFMGGTTNYIGSGDQRADVYSVNGFYFSKIVTPLRGYDYFELEGTRYALINAEFRYPFLDYLAMSFPLPLVISRVSGAVFFDMGSVWNRNSEFKGASSEGGFHLVDLKSGFGVGARLNLGIFLLRYDLAWPTDFDTVGKPHHYFSFGPEF